jgi:hypothetical protein
LVPLSDTRRSVNDPAFYVQSRIEFFDMEGDDDRIMHGMWFVNACF